MNALKLANLILRFVLELCALAALAYWGYQTGQGLAAKILLAAGAVVVAAVLWGIFAAPSSSRRLEDPSRLLFELVFFGAAVAGLIAAGQPVWGLALGVLFVINRGLLYVWGQ